MSSALYAIHSAKHYLSSNHLVMLHNALIYPYMPFGVLLWGSSFKTHTNKIVVLQKKAVRAIAHVPYNYHTVPIFRPYNLLRFHDIYNIYLGKYMYLQMNNQLPLPLIHNFSQCQDIHAYNTRQKHLLHKENRRTALVANSFIYKGPDYWNKLTDKLKYSFTVKSFNKRHKTFLLKPNNLIDWYVTHFPPIYIVLIWS